MSSKLMVNGSEGICFRLHNVVSLHYVNQNKRDCKSLWTDDDKTLVLIF